MFANYEIDSSKLSLFLPVDTTSSKKVSVEPMPNNCVSHILICTSEQQNPKWRLAFADTPKNNYGNYSSKSFHSLAPFFVRDNQFYKVLDSFSLRPHSDIEPLNDGNCSTDNSSFVWIHMLDITILPFLADKFKMHELFVNAFADCRAHSTVKVIKDEIMVCICVVQMLKPSEVNICK
jgi:hypothetical protein